MWFLQQILKIASIEAVLEQIIIFGDSGPAFSRHFDREDIPVEGKVGLLDIGFRWRSPLDRRRS